MGCSRLESVVDAKRYHFSARDKSLDVMLIIRRCWCASADLCGALQQQYTLPVIFFHMSVVSLSYTECKYVPFFTATVFK